MQDAEEASDGSDRRLSGRIHIMGLGNVGCFFAHSLASRQSRPPITLLLHRPSLYADWRRRKQSIALNINGLDDIKTGFDINVLDQNTWYSLPYVERNQSSGNGHANDYGDLDHSRPDDEKIECLIVTTKAQDSVAALRPISHRLTPDSTVCLVQNGMGAIEEINEKIFPDPSQRPHYMMGIISHGLTQLETFRIAHNGVGTTILSPIPADGASPSADGTNAEPDWAPSTKYLLKTLTLCPPLVAVAETPTNFLQFQLEKLAMNCVINSLTVLLNCKNGELLHNYNITRAMRLLLLEVSAVIRALPELQGVPGINTRFAPERLKNMAVNLAQRTARNTSSTLADVQRAKKTEVKHINGYIVRRGEELGISCPLNYFVMQLIQARADIEEKRNNAAVPLDLSALEDDEV